jgi:hypothetical protein
MQPGRPVAGADVPVPADGVCELDEPSVLFGDLEAGEPPRRTFDRRRCRLAHNRSPF